jgi:hypothetical protein
MEANEAKSVQVSFTFKTRTCPPAYLNNKQLPQTNDVKYLGIHLDRKLTWRKHTSAKRKTTGSHTTKLYWIIGRKSQLSLTNKLLVYKIILKPVWTYEIQMCGSAAKSHLENLERFQLQILRMPTDAPRYVPNTVLRRDLSSADSATGSGQLQRHLPTAACRSSQQPGKLIISRAKLQPQTQAALNRRSSY